MRVPNINPQEEKSGVRWIAVAAEKGMSIHKTFGAAMTYVIGSKNCWVYKEYNIDNRELVWRYNGEYPIRSLDDLEYPTDEEIRLELYKKIWSIPLGGENDR